MADPAVANRLTGRALLDRSLSGHPEEAILALLRIPFDDPEDLDLYRRRQRLAHLFSRVDPSRAATLHARLAKQRTDDELSRLFWKLSTPARSQMLSILEDKIKAHRQTSPAPVRAQFKPVRARPKDCPPRPGDILVNPTPVTRHPRYIDNLAQSVNRLLLTPDYFAIWEEGGKRYEIWVKPDWLSTRRVHYIGPYDIHPDRLRAMQAILDHIRCEPPIPTGTLPVAFYRGDRNAILPTTFTPQTAPRFFAGKAEFDKRYPLESQQQGYLTMLKGFEGYLNPTPFSITPEGEVDISSNPLDWLPLLKLKRPGKPPTVRGKRPPVGRLGSMLDALGEVGSDIRKIAGKNAKALEAAERMAERGYGKMVADIAQEYKTAPEQGAKLLQDLGKAA